jgi:hypothetical protein
MKPAPKAVQTITRELTAHNPMQLQLVFPEQGSLMQF